MNVAAGALPVFGRPAASIQMQSVLFNNAIEDLERTTIALARACHLAISDGVLSKVTLRLGDSGQIPALDPAKLERLRLISGWRFNIVYDYFGANLGSARGHNRLAEQAEEAMQFIWIQNPDVIVGPRLFENILAAFFQPGVGQVEAKQLPIEHPKDYDPATGETAWTTTACVMTPLKIFRELGGFDADSFFLYCDDVDLSFRIRELGYRLIFQPSAICFHDKRLGKSGEWQPNRAERFYSAQAGLMMAHKWSRPDLLRERLEHFERSGESILEEAASIFLQRRHAGTLPEPRDPDHAVARFHGHAYAKHRFVL